MDKIAVEERFNVSSLFSLVEGLRQERVLSNEQANLITDVANLSGDDAILANRAISRGADPFAIQYLAHGAVQPHIREAHFRGPGALEGEKRDDWLFLASLSVDEHGEPLSLREKLTHLVSAVNTYIEMGHPTTDSLKLQRGRAIERVKQQILDLPFEVENVGGREMRVYTADLGFAAAYWSGEDFAAVRQPDGITFVGSQEHSLADLGIDVNKVLSPTFGIIFP